MTSIQQRRQTKTKWAFYTLALILFCLTETTFTKSSATNFYTSPTGEGDCSSPQSPCSFTNVIKSANEKSSEEIIINLLPGTYSPSPTHLTSYHDITFTSTTSSYEDVKISFSSTEKVLFTIDKSKVTFKNIQFVDHLNTIISSPTPNDGSLTTIISCKFSNNIKQKAEEGGLAISSHTPLIIRSSIFSNNTMNNNGEFNTQILGSIIFSSDHAEIYDSFFLDNSITGNYSGISGGLILNQSNLTISNSVFKNNIMRGMFEYISGGVIFSSKELSVDKSTFENNQIQIDGSNYNGGNGSHIRIAGCAINSAKITSISSSQFIGNKISVEGYTGTASVFGGAVAISFGELSVDLSIFRNNSIYVDASNAAFTPFPESFYVSADADGGAISAALTSITNSVLENNSVLVITSPTNYVEVYGMGGAVQASVIALDNTNFTSNFVAAQIEDESMIYAPSIFSGGAISCSQIFASNCNFVDNRAYHSGGAIDIQETFFAEGSAVMNSSFVGNSADGEVMTRGGGAIFYSSVINSDGTEGILFINTTNFQNNQADFGSDVELINALSIVTSSGSVDVFIYNSYYDGSTPSSTPSFIRSPSPSPWPLISENYYTSQYFFQESSSESSSSSDNGDEGSDDTWWIVLVSVLSGVFVIVLFVSFIVVVIALFIIKRRGNHQYTAQSINDDAFGDDEFA